MASGDPIESRTVGPLPLLQRLIRAIGIPDVINDSVRWDPTRRVLSPGERIEVLILNILGGQRPLYRVHEFFEETATELLFHEGVTLAQLNDDCLARGLDDLAAAGARKVYSAVALRACIAEGIERTTGHFDTTSVSLYGEFPDLKDEDLQRVHGYSKDNLPELKQLVLALLCNRQGVPLWAEVRDGNSADAHANRDAIDDFCAALEPEDRRRMLWVADSALVTEPNLDRMSGMGLRFLSRLPERFAAAARAKDAAWAGDEWEDLGALALEVRPDSARYRVCEQRVAIGGRDYRAVVVHATGPGVRQGDSLQRKVEREREQLTKALAKLGKERFRCIADADSARMDFLARHAPDALHHIRLRVDAEQRDQPRAKPGRPRKGERRSTVTDYLVRGELLPPSAETLKREERHRASFVLITNEMDPVTYPARRLLQEYREQTAVEQRFRFIKDPLFIPGVYLHTPRRIEALGYVFVMACLVYSILERRVREALARSGEQIIVPGNRRTPRPTASMLLAMLKPLQVARVGRGPWRLSSSTDMQRRAAQVTELAGFDFPSTYHADPSPP